MRYILTLYYSSFFFFNNYRTLRTINQKFNETAIYDLAFVSIKFTSGTAENRNYCKTILIIVVSHKFAEMAYENNLPSELLMNPINIPILVLSALNTAAPSHIWKAHLSPSTRMTNLLRLKEPSEAHTRTLISPPNWTRILCGKRNQEACCSGISIKEDRYESHKERRDK